MGNRRNFEKDRQKRRAIENGRENVDGSFIIEGLGPPPRKNHVAADIAHQTIERTRKHKKNNRVRKIALNSALGQKIAGDAEAEFKRHRTSNIPGAVSENLPKKKILRLPAMPIEPEILPFRLPEGINAASHHVKRPLPTSTPPAQPSKYRGYFWWVVAVGIILLLLNLKH